MSINSILFYSVEKKLQHSKAPALHLFVFLFCYLFFCLKMHRNGANVLHSMCSAPMRWSAFWKMSLSKSIVFLLNCYMCDQLDECWQTFCHKGLNLSEKSTGLMWFSAAWLILLFGYLKAGICKNMKTLEGQFIWTGGN